MGLNAQGSQDYCPLNSNVMVVSLECWKSCIFNLIHDMNLITINSQSLGQEFFLSNTKFLVFKNFSK